MQIQEIVLTESVSPHLRGLNLFENRRWSELAAALFLNIAAMATGQIAMTAFAIALATVMAVDFGMQALGFSKKIRPDEVLLRQALLLILFLPANQSWPELIASAALLAAAYRVCGGRSGYILQPGCLALGLLTLLHPGHELQFALGNLQPLFAAGLFFLWMFLRMPRSRTAYSHIALIFILTLLLILLHGTNLFVGLLWVAAAGDLVLDPALAPLSVRGRIWYQIVTVILFALLLAAGPVMPALILTGLTAGFFSGWIEKRTGARKICEVPNDD